MDFTKSVDIEKFEVWYQPQIDMRNNKICGAEALVRCRNKNVIVQPSEFISIFEKDGRIVELDQLVLRKVCEDISSLKRNKKNVVPVSVNLSKKNAEKKGTGKIILDTIKKYNIRPTELAFEITESVSEFVIEKQMKIFVRKLQKNGFMIDMDDYGIGTSSLKSLADIKFDRLKIDKTFVSGIGSRKGEIILKSTIRMAEQLHMGIIAEGVETEKQVNFLKANGCYIAQGYFFFKPLVKEDYLVLCSR